MLDILDDKIYICCDNPDCCSGFVMNISGYSGDKSKEIIKDIIKDVFSEVSYVLKRQSWYCFKTNKKCGRYFVWKHYCNKCQSQGRESCNQYHEGVRLQQEKKIKIIEKEKKRKLRIMLRKAWKKGYVLTNDGVHFVPNPGRQGYTIDSKRYTLNGAVFAHWVSDMNDVKQQQSVH